MRAGRAFISVREADKLAAVEIARDLLELGFSIVATRGTAAVMAAHGVPSTAVNKVAEGRPHIVDMIKNHEVSLIVNTVGTKRNAVSDSRSIRVSALAQRLSYFTTIAGARAACTGMRHLDALEPYRLQQLHERMQGKAQVAFPRTPFHTSIEG